MANKYLDLVGLSHFWSLIKERLNSITSRIDDIELFKFPNATIIGQPTIQNGQISGFTVNNYLQFPFIVNFQGRPFSIDMCFTTGSDVSHQENILDSNFGLAFATLDRHFVIAMSTNGTGWDLGATSGAHTILPNTTYYVRIAWDGSVYTVSFSVDGEVYETDISVASTASLYPRQILIGVGDLGTAYPKVFSGTINLNKCSLTISDKVVWTGMDDVGLATRMAVDMSNIDDAGVNKVKEIASTVASESNLSVSPSEPSKSTIELWLDTDEDDEAIVGGSVFVSNDPPENPDVTVWIDPNEDPVFVESVNGKTGAVELSAEDVGARPDSWTPTAAEVGAVPAEGFVAASNPNLIDNGWFTVNQRDFSRSNAIGYTIDRWALFYNPDGGTLVLNNGGFTVADTKTVFVTQRFTDELRNALDGKTVTVSALYSDGTIDSGSVVYHRGLEAITAFDTSKLRCYYTDLTYGGFWFVFKNPNVTVRAVKLEYGSVSTLANDHAPDYATELLKCQRYFYRFKGRVYFTKRKDDYCVATVFLPVTMRETANASVSNIRGSSSDNISAENISPCAIQFGCAYEGVNSLEAFDITCDL